MRKPTIGRRAIDARGNYRVLVLLVLLACACAGMATYEAHRVEQIGTVAVEAAKASVGASRQSAVASYRSARALKAFGEAMDAWADDMKSRSLDRRTLRNAPHDSTHGGL